MSDRRVIDSLRRMFPGAWTYDQLRHPRWEHEDGWGVECYSVLAPAYDGDDSRCMTQYRRTDTGATVHGLPNAGRIYYA